MNYNYVGTRWHKCDLHLHTPASLCFKDRNVTPELWVEEAIKKGLDCVAVTDHNTNQWVDKIISAAVGTPLTVFPGVEITCSDAKVHLLIIFDKTKSGQEVYDFLIKAGIERESFGQQDAHTNKSIEDIAILAKERGALIIPAHIDEFNGICNVGSKILKDFLELPMINAVQVVHRCMLEVESSSGIVENLKEHYGKVIDNEKIRTWKNAVRVSSEKGKAFLTFSDNPHEKGDPKHGIWGLGRRYTWIKMAKEPSLEGLRQAFLSAAFRIRNDFDYPEGKVPFTLPEQWIKRLVIKNTEITAPGAALEIDFSPQLTTIIGGRGSGKSTILRFIRCLFQNKVDELARLGEKSFVFKDFSDFFQFPQGSGESGVLKIGTIIQLYFHRHEIEYRIELEQKNKNERLHSIYRYDSVTKDYLKDDGEGLIDLFEFDIFSQKQIYDIGSKTNSLRERIDSEVPEVAELKRKLEEIRKSYYQKCAEVRRIQSKVSKKPRLKTEIADLRERQQSLFKGNKLLQERESYVRQEEAIDSFINTIRHDIKLIDQIVDAFLLPEINLKENEIDIIIKDILSRSEVQLKQIFEEIEKKKENLYRIIDSVNTQIENSEWQRENELSRIKLEEAKLHLVGAGINLDDIEKVSDDLKNKQSQLEEIEQEEPKLARALIQKSELKDKYFLFRKTLTEKRKDFLNNLLKESNVRAQVQPYRDISDFEAQLRKILDKDLFTADFQKINDRILSGDAEQNCKKFIEDIITFKETENSDLFQEIHGKLRTSIKKLQGQHLDDLDLLAPEDEIIIKYKPNKSSSFKPISNLSPGQKTASILTILLTHKKTPLILDQPEDDLDSFLIYDLIVEQLKRSKEFRQVIVVSHNANVPVNGDSEHIVIMNPESKHIEKLEEGSIDKEAVKDFVLKVMEGGKDAFDFRSKRYKMK